MENLPTDIMTTIFNYLKKYVNYKDDLYLYRLVSRSWNYIICHITIKLPIKFWYWFARKSFDNNIFSPRISLT